MTSQECMALKAGTIVNVRWPGSNSGADTKRARVRRVNGAGTKVGVEVARTTPDGQYTGEYGKTVRWFPCEVILGAEAGFDTIARDPRKDGPDR
jgi:hypothetical protein